MTQVQPVASVSLRKARTGAAEWIARIKAELAVRKTARGRFTRYDTEYDIRRREFAIGFWLVERDHWRLHKLVVSNTLYFEFQIDKEVPFAHLSRTRFHPTKLIFYFDTVSRITVGISELSVSCLRTDKIRSDWAVERSTFRLRPNPPVPTT